MRKLSFMNNLEPLSYQLTTNSYGQVRATPLLLANILNSKLEQWFQNYKYTYLAVNQLSESEYKKSLQLEYNYSGRILDLRDFSEISSNVSTEVDLLNYHQLVKIVHEHIELAYKIYSSLEEKKEGHTVLDFEKHIQSLCKGFHKKNFPTKLMIIKKDLRLPVSLDTLAQINRVRNCLEHRAGIVSKEDCDNFEKYMSVKFRYPRISLPGGEISPTSDIKGKHLAEVNFTDEEKKFRIGNKVSFDFQDNAKLIFSLNICFKEIVDGIYNLYNVNQEETEAIIREFKNV